VLGHDIWVMSWGFPLTFYSNRETTSKLGWLRMFGETCSDSKNSVLTLTEGSPPSLHTGSKMMIFFIVFLFMWISVHPFDSRDTLILFLKFCFHTSIINPSLHALFFLAVLGVQ
jgi:hypothetical protein